MALLIDTPRWPWRGHLWAHLISDESLDELHDAARSLNLRWVSFGRDHYDVPDIRWEAACELATLVDSRDIIRSLRQTGLRVPGGKPQKSWRVAPALPPELHTAQVVSWLEQVAPLMADATIEVLTRPREWIVMHLAKTSHAPMLGSLAHGPAHDDAHVIETVADGRYSLELVIREM